MMQAKKQINDMIMHGNLKGLEDVKQGFKNKYIIEKSRVVIESQ